MSGSKRPCLLPIRRSTPGLVGVAARRCKIITVQTEHPTGLHRRVALYNTSASAVAGCSCSRPGSKTGGFVEKKIPSCKRHSGPAVGKCSPGRLPGVLQQGCFSQRKLRLDSSATLTIQGEVEEQPDTTTPQCPKAPGCPTPLLIPDWPVTTSTTVIPSELHAKTANASERRAGACNTSSNSLESFQNAVARSSVRGAL